MANQKDRVGASKSRSAGQSSPSVRVNKSKVTPLNEESLQKVAPRSRFSEWRHSRQMPSQQSSEESSNVTAFPLPHGSVRGSSRVSGPPPSTLKKWLVFLVTFVVLALLFVGVVFFSPLLAVRTITVEGARLLPASAVEEKLQPLEGRPVTRISESEVQTLIGESNVLREVSIQARPPHELLVTLHERVPLAVVQDGDQVVLVDSEGVQLGHAKSADEAGLPEIEGGTDVLTTPEFRTIASVLAALPQSLLSEVNNVKADSASTIRLNMKDDIEVIWGTSQDSELKAKVLTQLRAAVDESGTVKTFDVSSPLVPTTK